MDPKLNPPSEEKIEERYRSWTAGMDEIFKKERERYKLNKGGISKKIQDQHFIREENYENYIKGK